MGAAAAARRNAAAARRNAVASDRGRRGAAAGSGSAAGAAAASCWEGGAAAANDSVGAEASVCGRRGAAANGCARAVVATASGCATDAGGCLTRNRSTTSWRSWSWSWKMMESGAPWLQARAWLMSLVAHRVLTVQNSSNASKASSKSGFAACAFASV